MSRQLVELQKLAGENQCSHFVCRYKRRFDGEKSLLSSYFSRKIADELEKLKGDPQNPDIYLSCRSENKVQSSGDKLDDLRHSRLSYDQTTKSRIFRNFT